jgi:chaperonin GroES
MKLQPLADQVVMKAIEAETKTSSGILLSVEAQRPPRSAEVLAIGKDVQEVKVGDQVIYGKHAVIDMASEELLIAKEEDIFAVVKGGK